MTREELKAHCEHEIEMCKFWARVHKEEPHGKIYEEHKLILELLEQEPVLDKIRAEIEDMDAPNYDFEGFYKCQSGALQIIDKYKAETEAE